MFLTQGEPNPFQYAAGYFEGSTGLVKLGTRYDNPALGRWTQQDPVGGSLGNSDNLNRYLYVGDDPVNLVDPSGATTCYYVSNGTLEAYAWAWIGAGTFTAVLGGLVAGTVIGLPLAGVLVGVGAIEIFVGTFLLWSSDKYYPNGVTRCA